MNETRQATLSLWVLAGMFTAGVILLVFEHLTGRSDALITYGKGMTSVAAAGLITVWLAQGWRRLRWPWLVVALAGVLNFSLLLVACWLIFTALGAR